MEKTDYSFCMIPSNIIWSVSRRIETKDLCLFVFLLPTWFLDTKNKGNDSFHWPGNAKIKAQHVQQKVKEKLSSYLLVQKLLSQHLQTNNLWSLTLSSDLQPKKKQLVWFQLRTKETRRINCLLSKSILMKQQETADLMWNCSFEKWKVSMNWKSNSSCELDFEADVMVITAGSDVCVGFNKQHIFLCRFTVCCQIIEIRANRRRR